VLDTLEMALWSRQRDGIPFAEGMICHNDAGSQPRLKRSSQRRSVISRTVGARALSVIDLIV
jgi:hypothetical protein